MWGLWAGLARDSQPWVYLANPADSARSDRWGGLYDYLKVGEVPYPSPFHPPASLPLHCGCLPLGYPSATPP